MKCDAFWLLKLVVADVNTIQMPNLHLPSCVETAGGGVSQSAAETIGIWQDRSGLTTQRIDNTVRKCIYDIAQSLSIIHIEGAGPEQYNLLIAHCIS